MLLGPIHGTDEDGDVERVDRTRRVSTEYS